MTSAGGAVSEVADRIWLFGSAHGPNSVAIGGAGGGSGGLILIDGQPTRALADQWAEEAASLGAGPVRYRVLTHFHASRWAQFAAPGDAPLIATRKCRTMLIHRGAAEAAVDRLRSPAAPAEAAAGPPAVDLAFKSGLTLYLGGRQVDFLTFGKAHTAGDAVVWVRDAGAMITGDIVERGAAPFMGDAAPDDWVGALDLLAQYRPSVLIPGRGPAATGRAAALDAIGQTRRFVSEMTRIGAAAANRGDMAAVLTALQTEAPPEFRILPDWDRRLPFAAARLDEAARGGSIPGVWTPERVARIRAALGV